MNTKVAQNGNSTPAGDVHDLVVDVDLLREEMGVSALEQRVEAQAGLIEQLLAYTNYVDLRLQELAGEGVVTQEIRYDIDNSGRVSRQRLRPPAPANLKDNKLKIIGDR